MITHFPGDIIVRRLLSVAEAWMQNAGIMRFHGGLQMLRFHGRQVSKGQCDRAESHYVAHRSCIQNAQTDKEEKKEREGVK